MACMLGCGSCKQGLFINSLTAVGISFTQKEAVIEVAKEMIKNGAQLIELCGSFGPLWIAKVSEAIDYIIKFLWAV